MVLGVNVIVLYVVLLIVTYGVVEFIKGRKKDVLEVAVTSIFILVVGWLNTPNVFPISNEWINNDFSFLPYNLLDKYGIVYVFFTSLIMVTLVELLKNLIKQKYTKEIKKKNINNLYDDFLEDATEIFAIGKDLDFLKNNQKQIDKFKNLGRKCKILITSEKLDEKIKIIYRDLLDHDVDIRRIDSRVDINEFSNLRGQIKIDTSGVIKCLFVEKNRLNSEMYNRIEITNRFIIESLKEEFLKIHNNGRHPLIKAIAMDLGGVFFDGDFRKDFIDVVNRKLITSVCSSADDTVIFDEDLNLGKKDIVDVWVEKTNKTFNADDKKFIKETWKNVWKPNSSMEDIVENLVALGYDVYPFGNIDESNGNHYKINNFFSKFNKDSFMSYEMDPENKCCLPRKEFLKCFEKQEKLLSCEILLIDDELKDIKTAEISGWYSQHFNIQYGADKLTEKLKKLNVLKDSDM